MAIVVGQSGQVGALFSFNVNKRHSIGIRCKRRLDLFTETRCGPRSIVGWHANSMVGFSQGTFQNSDSLIGARIYGYIDVDDTCCKRCRTVETSDEASFLQVCRCSDIESFRMRIHMRCKRTHRPRMGNFGSPTKYTLATRIDSIERNEASLVEIDLGFSMQVVGSFICDHGVD